MAQTYFASIQPGLEEFLLQEIRTLPAKRPRVLTGGIEFSGTRKTLYLCGLQLATATRIWLRLDEFRARDAAELYNKTRRFEWERLITPGTPLSMEAHSSQSSLYHTGKIADALYAAISDRFTDELGLQAPGQSADGLKVMARLFEDRAELSLDAAGELLSRRGWRTQAGPAPLRESLAAVLLDASHWTPTMALLDPFCGSGTIPITAARRQQGLLPGEDRTFAFQHWANYDADLFTALKQSSRSTPDAHNASSRPPIFGTDIDPDVLSFARENAVRARVSPHLRFLEADIARLPQTLPDLSRLNTPLAIVTNPPYGARLQRGDALNGLLTLAKTLPHASLTFLWPRDSRDLVLQAGFAPESLQASFENGGLPVDLWHHANSPSPGNQSGS